MENRDLVGLVPWLLVILGSMSFSSKSWGSGAKSDGLSPAWMPRVLPFAWRDPWRRIEVVMSDGIVWVSVDDEDFGEWRPGDCHVSVMKSGGDESEICGRSVVVVVVVQQVVDVD